MTLKMDDRAKAVAARETGDWRDVKPRPGEARRAIHPCGLVVTEPETFAPGDLVVLRSTSRKMTVADVREDGAVSVVWWDFEGSALKKDIVVGVCLRKVPDGAPEDE